MRTVAYFAELLLCILLCSCLQLQFELAFSTTMSDSVYSFHLGKCSQLQWEDSTLSLKSILKCISFLFLNLSCILNFSTLKKNFWGLCGYSVTLWLDVLISLWCWIGSKGNQNWENSIKLHYEAFNCKGTGKTRIFHYSLQS